MTKDKIFISTINVWTNKTNSIDLDTELPEFFTALDGLANM